MSWASNLDPEDSWDLCGGCQIVAFGGGLLKATELQANTTASVARSMAFRNALRSDDDNKDDEQEEVKLLSLFICLQEE